MKQDIKEWTLSVVNECSKEFTLFLADVPKKEREIKGEIKEWSVKDQIAHLTFWFEIFVENIHSYRNGKSLISTKDYLKMNDMAWEDRKNLSWAEIEDNFIKAIKQIEIEVKRLNIEELIDGNIFSVEPHRNPPRPFTKSLLYELIDHPFKHLTKQYVKFGNREKAIESLKRISNVLKQHGFSKWANASLSKIQKLNEGLN